MAINLSDLQDVDIADLSTWPDWFKGFMVSFIFLGLLYVGYHFIVSGQLDDIDKLKRQESELKVTFLDRKAEAINLQAYRDQMQQMQTSFGVLVDQLPDKNEVPQLLIDITQAGLSQGLKFRTFKPKGEQADGFYATLPIDLEVQGDYHQFGVFVSELAALPRIVTIGNLTLIGSEDGELSVKALVKTYRYLEDEELSSVKPNKKTRTIRQ
jgi:type IV pilus assembly protein PilO